MFEYLFKNHPTGGYIKSIIQIKKNRIHRDFLRIIQLSYQQHHPNGKIQHKASTAQGEWNFFGRLKCVWSTPVRGTRARLVNGKEQPFQEVTFLRPISRVFFPNCNKLETESVCPRSTGIRTAKSQFAIFGIPVRIRQGANQLFPVIDYLGNEPARFSWKDLDWYMCYIIGNLYKCLRFLNKCGICKYTLNAILQLIYD